MRILYIGGGFVGTCSAAVSAASGHQVLVYDVDAEKVRKLGSGDRDTIESCLFEEGLGDLLVHHAERIEFSTDYAKVEAFLNTADAVFVCVPTPEIDETGETNLSYYDAAVEKLAKNLAARNGGAQEKYITIVNKSTVPIAAAARAESMLQASGVKNVGVVSNPEFLVEGKAIQGSLKPDRIVVGARSDQDFAVMRELYQRFVDSPTTTYIEVNPEEAAASKLLANYYLFNKLALCFDVTGRLTETFPGMKFENLRRVLTTDPRIGEWGFYDSLYSGGSCFIKDARSLAHQLESQGKNAVLVRETHAANRRQLESFLARPGIELGFDWKGKTVALIGLAFKRDTNDIRNSPSTEIVDKLLSDGVASIRAYDPAATDVFKSYYPESQVLSYSESAREAIAGTDVIIIATDWPAFRGLADDVLAEKIPRLIMDGRRMFQHRYAELVEAGSTIIAVGSPLLQPKK